MLFYGPAGAGKTTLLLLIAGNVCGSDNCVYISTEETLHYEKVAKNPERYNNVLFTEAYDMDTLLKAAFTSYLLKPRFVFVDSINALFRVEAMKENTLAKQALITGLLLETATARSGKLFASAQVRVGNGLEAPGAKIIDYYFDALLGVFVEKAGKRYLKPLKVPLQIGFEKLEFRITEVGVEWLE